ncbi:hypothetical protein ACLOJK_022250 [Asimina triloba]
MKVNGYPVYSMATPTIDGAKEMLAYLGAHSTAGGSFAQKVILTDLREEAVVYINGTPFVLRELDQPVDTLKHVGITGPVVEHMEARMKEDIIAEVTQSGGRMLLHREELNPVSKQTCVVGYWENISLDDVRTPTEVYASLIDGGYNIEYRRIPLTREREALATDIDAIQSCQDEYVCSISADGQFASEKPDSPVTTNCISSMPKEHTLSCLSEEEALKQGDYRDILSLTRVLMYGPKSKEEVDSIIERCAGAGHLRDDVFHYRKDLENCHDCDEEKRSHLEDMGKKALRSYLSTSSSEKRFAAWMDARPELGHLCDNLRFDK